MEPCRLSLDCHYRLMTPTAILREHPHLGPRPCYIAGSRDYPKALMRCDGRGSNDLLRKSIAFFVQMEPVTQIDSVVRASRPVTQIDSVVRASGPGTQIDSVVPASGPVRARGAVTQIDSVVSASGAWLCNSPMPSYTSINGTTELFFP